MIKIKCANPDSCYLVRNEQRKYLVPFTEGFYHPQGGIESGCATEEARRNWMRFCDMYGLEEVIFPTPMFKIVGSRSRILADNFFYNVVSFMEHYFTMKTKDGEYKFVVCLPEVDFKHYTQKEIWLGEYNGYDYVATREDLPSEYTFYFDEHHKYSTLVWSVKRNERKNGK